MPRAWGIKLGSGGICIPFCENHSIVGIGWKMIDPKILSSGTREELWVHVKDRCRQFYSTDRSVGAATGQLFRFWRECEVGDYILYYDPPKKQVRLCKVMSGPTFRQEEFGKEDSDIWQYRKVEYPVKPISIVDFDGALKGSLLGPRMSFWDMTGFIDRVDQIAKGLSPSMVAAPDPAIQGAYRELENLLRKRAEVLNEKDWEILVADYFRAQGARVNEKKVGGNQAVLDFEARFPRGEFGADIWRIQVKRYQDKKVEWKEVKDYSDNIGENYNQFCFVSVFGFTDEARAQAYENDIRLLDASDFTRFLLSGIEREELARKLKLPLFKC